MLNIHVLLPEGSAQLLVLFLSSASAGTLCASALFASEELPGPNVITNIQQTKKCQMWQWLNQYICIIASYSPPNLDGCKLVHQIFFSHGG